jgi:hypothetical protein
MFTLLQYSTQGGPKYPRSKLYHRLFHHHSRHVVAESVSIALKVRTCTRDLNYGFLESDLET